MADVGTNTVLMDTQPDVDWGAGPLDFSNEDQKGASLQAHMSSRIAALRSALDDARTEAAGGIPIVSGFVGKLEGALLDNQSSRDATMGAFNLFDGQIAQLEKDELEIINGSVDVSNWDSRADNIQQNIVGNSATVKDWSFSGIGSNTVKASISDAGNMANRVANAAADFGSSALGYTKIALVILGAFLVLILVIKLI